MICKIFLKIEPNENIQTNLFRKTYYSMLVYKLIVDY